MESKWLPRSLSIFDLVLPSKNFLICEREPYMIFLPKQIHFKREYTIRLLCDTACPASFIFIKAYRNI